MLGWVTVRFLAHRIPTSRSVFFWRKEENRHREDRTIFFLSIQLSTRYLLNLKSITKYLLSILLPPSSIFGDWKENHSIHHSMLSLHTLLSLAIVLSTNPQERILFVNSSTKMMERSSLLCVHGVRFFIYPQSLNPISFCFVGASFDVFIVHQSVHFLVILSFAFSFLSSLSFNPQTRFHILPAKFVFHERHKWWSNFHNSQTKLFIEFFSPPNLIWRRAWEGIEKNLKVLCMQKLLTKFIWDGKNAIKKYRELICIRILK